MEDGIREPKLYLEELGLYLSLRFFGLCFIIQKKANSQGLVCENQQMIYRFAVQSDGETEEIV